MSCRPLVKTALDTTLARIVPECLRGYMRGTFVTCRPNIEASMVSPVELYKSELASRIIENLVHVNDTFTLFTSI
jgi:hypothetical protein